MLPAILYRCPERITPRIAEDMARIVDTEYRALTKRANVYDTIRRKGQDPITVPVVCVSTAGVHGYWSLECNDPEMPADTMRQLVDNIRKWEGAPADPK